MREWATEEVILTFENMDVYIKTDEEGVDILLDLIGEKLERVEVVMNDT